MVAIQVQRTLVALDIEQFGNPDRHDQIRVQLRDDLLVLVTRSLARVGIAPGSWSAASTGDGLLVVVDPTVEAARVLRAMLDQFAAGLAERNQGSNPSTELRVRGVVHAGYVMVDQQGITGGQVNLAFRILDDETLRQWLRLSPGPLVLAVSADIYEQVVRQRPLELDPAAFSPITVLVKETRTTAWVHPPAETPTGAGGKTIGELLPQDGDAQDDPAFERFEQRYRQHVAETLGRLELFGVSRDGMPTRQSFDKAYVRLTVARSTRTTDRPGDDLTGSGIDIWTALEDQKRILIRGGAGSGKTTLLDWVAARAADPPAEGSRKGSVVPFVVRLRQFAGTEFPTPEALPSTVAKALVGAQPAGWATRQFETGRALLLVDGVDELEPSRRPEAKQWLEQLAVAYKDARYVVTARPLTRVDGWLDDNWLSEAGFATFDLLPLSLPGIRDFIGKWHDAVRERHISDTDADTEVGAWLDAREQELTELLSARPELRSFAVSPLLCGLLCALYHDRGEHLPSDRKGLYDAALELLLVRWDTKRKVEIKELPSLSYQEQVVLLQRFAYHLVKNHKLVVSRQDATSRIANAMQGFRFRPTSPEPILQRLLERTGLLRAPDPTTVQFLHRTFQDYLAAKEVVDSGDFELMIEHAHEDHWHEVVISSIAHASLEQRDQLLGRLLQGNATAQHDSHIRDRLYLVAAACLEQADVLHTDRPREEVRRAAQRLIPPASLSDAELLAKAGAFVLDLLPGPEGLTKEQAAAVIRTAAMIGGDQAWDKLAAFVVIGEANVIDELLRAWRVAEDPEDYARTVLSRVAFGDLHVNMLAGPRVRSLRHLTSLTNLTLKGDYALLKDIAAMPSLRRLKLEQNLMLRDLSPLVGCTTLRSLELAGGQFLKDLSPLADTTVEELTLKLVPADLSTLCCRRLRHLRIRDPRLRDGLLALPAGLPLRKLSIGNPPRSRSLLGVDRWQDLDHVEMTGIPRADEIEALKRLPKLAWLSLHTPERPEDLAILDPIDRITDLVLWDLDPSGRDAAEVALRHRPDLRIHFIRTRS